MSTIYSCKTAEPTSTNELPVYVIDFLNSTSEDFEYDFAFSDDEAQVLCSKKPMTSGQEYVYSIYDLSTGQEIYSGSFIGSEVSWFATNKIQLIGTSRLENEPITVLDIVTKKTEKIYPVRKK
ncbi:MAG: hypothetical protein JXR10_12175 [Cyclobacteriaceae bacterium]